MTTTTTTVPGYDEEENDESMELGKDEDAVHQIIAGNTDMLRRESNQVMGSIHRANSETHDNDGNPEEIRVVLKDSGSGMDIDKSKGAGSEKALESDTQLGPIPESRDNKDAKNNKGRKQSKFSMADPTVNPDNGDNETQYPGAVRVAPSNRSTEAPEDQQSEHLTTDPEAQGDVKDDPELKDTDKNDQGIVKASVLDEEKLETEFKNRMMSNMVTATEVVQESDDKETPEIQPTSCWQRQKTLILCGIVFCAVLALILGLTLPSNGSEESGSEDTPTPAPTLAPTLSDQGYLEELLLPVSGDAIYDESTPQFQALTWLAEDPWMVGVFNEDTAMSNITDSQIIERYVMAVLYFSTGGSEWADDLRFLSNYSICEWPNIGEDESQVTTTNEVDCDDSGHVIKLRIEQNNMNGTLPSELSVLGSVEIISLAVGNLHGTLPPELGRISTLKFLQLVDNMITGTIPSSFAGLTNLEVISVYNNLMSGSIPFEFIQSGYNIEIYDFARNYFQGTLPEFVTQSGIERIYMEENELEGQLPQSLYTLSSLQQLFISSNRLNTTLGEQIGVLKELQVLDVGGAGVRGSLPSALGDCRDLQFAFLGNNELTGSLPNSLGDLDKLVRIDLSSNRLVGSLPNTFRQLDDLTFLDISSNSLTGTVPRDFQEMTSLTRFALSGNNITGGLDVAFCDRPYMITEIEADCLGESSDLDCDCCTSCCDNNSTCSLNINAICETKASKFELDTERGASCDCSENGTMVSCSDTTCESCNLDESVCAINKDYGYTLDGTTGEILSFQNHMEYVTGYDGTVVTFEHDGSCTLSVNGEECRSCGNIQCSSGLEGFQIFCDNLDGGFNFNSCEEWLTVGFLEVISLFDGSTLSGCPPLLERV